MSEHVQNQGVNMIIVKTIFLNTHENMDNEFKFNA